MAKHYSIPYGTFAVDFETALKDYYGDGATIESASGRAITFTCPQICDKLLALSTFGNNYHPTLYLKGVFDGAVTFHSGGSTASSGGSSNSAVGPYHLILADNFLLLQVVDSGTATFSSSILVAKTTNGRFLCMGGLNGTSTYGKCYFTDDPNSRPVYFMAPAKKRVRMGKKIPIVQSYFAVNGEMELNADGTLAYIEGLYLTGEITTGGIVGLNYFLSNASINGSTTDGTFMPSAFYVELE